MCVFNLSYLNSKAVPFFCQHPLSPCADINTFIRAHNSFYSEYALKYLTKVLTKHLLEAK